MPIKKIDYANTIIYKIVCNDASITDMYIGHTTDFRRRKNHHKSDCNNSNNKNYNYKIYQIIRANGGWDNWAIVQIEIYPCSDGNEARARERYWFDIFSLQLNTIKPYTTEEELKEYNDALKEHIRQQQREYYDAHKSTRLQYQKKYYDEHREHIRQQHKEYYKSKK